MVAPQKQKTWKMDSLRNDDRQQMQNMIRKLRRYRDEDQSGAKKSIQRDTTSTSVSSAKDSKPGNNPPQNRVPAKKSSKHKYITSYRWIYPK